jgi:phenylacetic acid degradation operon negative regulatory protein
MRRSPPSPPVTPKSLVFDLLRVAPDGASIRELVRVGALFRLSGNALRVAVARLTAAGLLSSDERGWYRLAQGASEVGAWVDAWREGDKRLGRWDGSFLAAHLEPAARAPHAGSVAALRRLGFVEGLQGTWVRPNNLTLPRAELGARLSRLGLAPSAELFVICDVSDTLCARWVERWPSARVAAQHRAALAALGDSAPRLDTLTLHEAVVESYLLGGAAIRSLARDPLLPDELAPGDARRALVREMTRYDGLGRRVWERWSADLELERSPSHGQPLEVRA